MSDIQLFAKRFWGFDPKHEPIIPFRSEGDRDRLLEASRPGDLILFVGTQTEGTAPPDQGRLLGLAEIGRNAIEAEELLDLKRLKASEFDEDGRYRWPKALPMLRAWRFLTPPRVTDVLRKQLPREATVRAVPLESIDRDAVMALPREEVSLAGMLSRRPMTTALVLVENEMTAGGHYDHWQDVTGERYQFPNQYRNRVRAGRPFVYYRGVRRENGLRGTPEYFGAGVIGSVYLDPSNKPNTPKSRLKWLCEIEDYRPFPSPVPAKDGTSYLEKIPQNIWSVAVRELPSSVFAAILKRADLPPVEVAPSSAELHLPPIEQVEPTVADSSLLSTPSKVNNGSSGLGRNPPRRSRYSAALGKRGEEIVLLYLRRTLSNAEAATLRWNADEGDLPGWDIEYFSAGQLNAIEVKATGGSKFPSIELSANEWNAAGRLGSAYRIFLVAQVKSTSPQIQFLSDPAALERQGRIALEPSMWRLVIRESE